MAVESKWYVVGGLVNNEQSAKIYCIDLEEKTVKLLKPTGDKLEPMDSHTAVLASPNQILIFGGYLGARKSNRMFIYQIAENTTKELKPKSAGTPPPRSDHSAVISQGTMVVFGGTDADGEKLADLWKFDIEKQEWSNVPVAEDMWPRARSGHAAAVHGNAMLVFGGSLNIMQEVNEFFTFNIGTNKWDVIHPSEKMTGVEERGSPLTSLKMRKVYEDAKRRVKGESLSPTGRGYGSIIKLNKGGEHSPSPKLSNSLDSPKLLMRRTFMKSQRKLNESEYKRIEADDEASSPIVAVMKNSIVMKATSSDRRRGDNGGMNGEGSKMVVGRYPCERDGHAVAINGSTFYVFGGDRCQMAYNDLFAFPLT